MSTKSTSQNTERNSRPVQVAIRSRQQLDGQDFLTQQEHSGILTATAHGWLLEYQETSSDAPDTITTTLTLSGQEAVLTRSGSVRCQMRFAPGKTDTVCYETSLGSLDLHLATTYLGHTLSPTGGNIMVRYTLSAQGQPMGDYTLKLHIKEKDD